MEGIYFSNAFVDTNTMTFTCISKKKLSDYPINTSYPSYGIRRYISRGSTPISKVYKINFTKDNVCWGMTALLSVFRGNLEIEYTIEDGLNILITSKVNPDNIYIYELSDDMETGDVGLKLYDEKGNITFNLSTNHLPFSSRKNVSTTVDDPKNVIAIELTTTKSYKSTYPILTRWKFSSSYPFGIVDNYIVNNGSIMVEQYPSMLIDVDG